MKEITFTCPECGEHELEEVMVDVMVTSTMTNLSIEDGVVNCDYGDATNEDGVTDHYQCKDCGYVLELKEEGIDPSGDLVSYVVTSLEDLARWFEENENSY